MLNGTSCVCLTQAPKVVKKLVTVDEGGVIKKDEVTLTIGPGCLAEDTEITLINDDQNLDFSSLLELNLVDTTPRIFEFLPDGLKFLKPAHLTITFEAKTTQDSELFILHGSTKDNHPGTVWELVNEESIKEHSAEGIAKMEINGFCFYTLFKAKRGTLSRILSHLNKSFSCRAYVFYRRMMNTIDISVVIISHHAEKNHKEIAQQLQDHIEQGYTQGEKGMLKSVQTKRQLEISLHFPGIQRPPYLFEVDVPHLDSVGFVVDHFTAIVISRPANGAVEIHELQRNEEKDRLWRLNVCEEHNATREEGL